jgi:hypothetical protein
VANIVQEITDGLKAQVATTLPLRTESRYIWDFKKNAFKNNSSLYAIRPSSGSSVSGTNRTITVDQGFELILSTEFKNKGDNDAALDAAIYSLYEDHEAVYKVWFQRNLAIARVLVIDSIELNEPDVDDDNNIVSITARFNVKYRTET